mmetsp:Transcript_129851/g.259039  ORF Transcript_129851/g.259039 Transcript_129851/m.259039 type:complete len:111 (+) Transcript_129851:1294-1626(+)
MSEVAGEGVVGPSKSSQICISLNTLVLRPAEAIAGADEELSKELSAAPAAVVPVVAIAADAAVVAVAAVATVTAVAADVAVATAAGISIMVGAGLHGEEILAAVATEAGG